MCGRFSTRFILTVVAGLLVFALPGAYAQTATEQGDTIIADLSAQPFGNAAGEWEKQAPGASWQSHRGDPQWRRTTGEPAGLWCKVATDVNRGVQRTAAFYAIRTATPVACRLEQLHFLIAVPPEQRGALYDELESRLTRLFSLGNHGPERDRPPGAPSTGWTEIKRWRLIGVSAWLFLAPDGVGVFAQHDVLRSVVESRGVSPQPLTTHGFPTLTWEVANELRSEFPEASRLLLTHDAILDQEAVLQSVKALLGSPRRNGASARRTTAIGYAANAMFQRLWIDGERHALSRPPFSFLRSFGVSCDYDRHDNHWTCTAPLWSAYPRSNPHTRWSHLAYFDALGTECDSLGYLQVVREGPSWLARHPNSGFEPFVLQAIAEAYETWWSLSLAPKEEEFAVASDHAGGVDRARTEALRWFSRLRERYPDSAEALASAVRANQIAIGVDTGQRRFFCVIP